MTQQFKTISRRPLPTPTEPAGTEKKPQSSKSRKPNFCDINCPFFKQFRVDYMWANKWLRTNKKYIDPRKLGALNLVRAYRKHGKEQMRVLATQLYGERANFS